MKLKKALFKAACLLPDKAYLQLAYYIIFRKFLNLKNPVTFNEKLQWLKLYDHNPRYTRLVDKVEVKREVARIIGNEYIIPTLGVWDNASDIDFDSLPNQFVLKTNHSGGSSGVIICRDKATFDKEDAVKKLNHSLKTDAYLYGREWPYKNVRRKILAEELLEDKTSYDLKDYKFFCFDGKVEFLKVDFNRFENHQANYLTPEWSVLPFGEKICPPDYDKTIEKPENFNEMLALAEKVAKDIPFARVDFYNVTGRTYFGEITFYPASGFGTFTSQEADKEIGRMLKLSNRGGYIIDFKQYIMYIHPDWDIHKDIVDYKFFCFNGVPKLCQVIGNRRSDETIDFYDMNWQRLIGLIGLNTKVHNSQDNYPEPVTFHSMKKIVAKLSAGIPFARIDLYEVNGKCYFGEITLYPASGFGEFKPTCWNKKVGDWLALKC